MKKKLPPKFCLLRVGEIIAKGDECYDAKIDQWRKVGTIPAGERWNAIDFLPMRRAYTKDK